MVNNTLQGPVWKYSVMRTDSPGGSEKMDC